MKYVYIIKSKYCVGLILLLFALIGTTVAQELQWAKSAGGTLNDFCYSIAVDPQGNSYVTGNFNGSVTFGFGETNETTLSGMSGEIFVAKFDDNGLLLWATSAGGTKFDNGLGVAVDFQGNSYITGNFKGSATFGDGEANETTLTDTYDEIFVAKYDDMGRLLWAKSADNGTGNNNSYSIAVDSQGNSYVTGNFENSVTFGSGEASETTINATDRDLFIAKYDTYGQFLWVKSSYGANHESGWGIAVDSQGNSYVTGLFYNLTTFGLGDVNETILSGTGGEYFLAKYDLYGKLLWAKSASGSNFEQGFDITVDSNGISYITGIFSGSATFGIGEVNETTLSATSYDIFVAKYDVSGKLLWAKSAGGADYDYGYGIAADSEGNCYVTGNFKSSAIFGAGEANETTLTGINDEIYIVKYDSAGQLLWAKSAGGASNDISKAIAVDSQGNSYLSGWFIDSATFGAGQANMTTLTGVTSALDLFVGKFAGGPTNNPPNCNGAAVADQSADSNCGATISGADVTGVIDPDDDPLTITVNPATLVFGANTVTVTADDGNGGTCSIDIIVNVTGGISTLTGSVLVESVGLGGVKVALLDTMGNAADGLDTLITDTQGNYSFGDISPGIYLVNVIEPLGYTAEENPIIDTLLSCTTNNVNFTLDQEVTSNSSKSAIYWAIQFRKNLWNCDHVKESKDDLLSYIEDVHDHYTPHFSIFENDVSLQDWMKNLRIWGKFSWNKKAKRQLSTLVMNMVSGKVGQYTIVTEDSRTAGDVLTYVSSLVMDEDSSNDKLAMKLARKINRRRFIDAGIIPDSNILYKGNLFSFVDYGFGVPEKFQLRNNYPNPFNPNTTIAFDLPKASYVKLEIYNSLGQNISVLVDGYFDVGFHKVIWDAGVYASGIYYYRIVAGSNVEIEKMILMK